MKRLFSVLIFCSLVLKMMSQGVDTFLIKARLANLRSPVVLEFNDDMLHYLKDLLANPGNKTSDMLFEAGKVIPFAEKVIKDKKMPTVLTYLPFVITGYINENNPEDGRVGYWNMPYAVARKYDLLMNSYIDERYGIVASTESAMDYLSDLKLEFGDWRLAILAFCTSPTSVHQHIYKASNGKTFESIECDLEPGEKRFLNQFTAAVYLFNYYKEKDVNINVKKYVKPYNTDTVDVYRRLTFENIASKTGINIRDLRLLNPIYKLETVPYNEAPHSLIIPSGYLGGFDSLLQNYPNIEAVRPVIDTPTIIHDSDITKQLPASAVTPSASKKVPVYYKVKSGDNLYGIADLFDCSAADLKRWNKITRNYLIAGQNLVFYVPASKKAKYLKMNTLTPKQKKVLIYQD